MANRYLYLAFAGFLICAGRLSAPLWGLNFKGLPVLTMLCAVIGLSYCGLSMRNLACYSDPVDLWTRAVQNAPEHARAHLNLASALAARMRWADAEQEYRAACRYGRGIAVDSRKALAETMTARGDDHHAALLAEAILREDGRYGSNQPMLRLLGACQLKHGADEKARKTLLKALAVDPYDGPSRLNLGLYYESAGQPKRAEIAWDALRTSPESRIYALGFLARLYAKTRRVDKARKTYEEILSEQPLRLDAVQELAELYAREGRREKALGLFDSMIDSLRTQQKAMQGVSAEMSAMETSRTRDVLAATYHARSRFLSRHPASHKP